MKTGRLKWLWGFLWLGLAAQAFAATALKEEAIMLDTGSGTLAGTLMLPASAAKAPVALIIAGSGPTDRDGNSSLASGPNDSLKMLARALGEAGIATLRYDKRGVAASAAAGPAESALRFDMYVDDAVKWAEKLHADSRFAPLVIIGHSEGSLIGMVAAQRVKPAAFISVAGSGEPGLTLLRKQFAGKLPPALVLDNERILTELEHGRLVNDIPPALATFWRPSVQPYLISWFKHDPAQAIARLGMPVLLVQGDNDIQVGVEQARALKAAKREAALSIIPGMNHVLKTVPANDLQQNLASYASPALPLAPTLASAITDFLRAEHLLATKQ